MPASLLLLFSPVLLTLAAFGAFAGPRFRPRWTPRIVETAALVSLGASVLAAILLASGYQPAVSIPAADALASLLRLDAVSAIMTVLVCFIGWIVLRYSAGYLDGEARQGPFLGWMALTLAAVLSFVAAGHLAVLVAAWIATSLSLQRLLLFYPDRPEAQRVARKKFLTARVADVALIGASAILWVTFESGEIGVIAAQVGHSGNAVAISTAAGLIAIAAVLKSALFPTQGWLTEVMETPTPVSALLHAGVINAGGVLLIRLSDVVTTSPGAMAFLVIAGGLSAVVGGLAMLAQTAVKTSLAWSTVAQMGFMILQCGLGLWPLALLHIVAHSLYKAHAFLSSGNAVEEIAATRRPGPVATPSGMAVARAFTAALAIYAVIYALFGWVIGFDAKSPQSVALGAILILGVAYLIAQGLADAAPRALTQRTALASLSAAVSYFLLQAGAEWLTRGALPPTPEAGPLEWALIVLTVLSFGAVAVAQALFPLWSDHPAALGLRVHLANGLYTNAVFDRLTGGWLNSPAKS
jgi:NAD(P)H-quinone oxidoreductase subunit 5